MFDKSRCINNIYALAKEQNVKIGDLEEKANMSTGYLSRLNKEGNSALPGVDALVIIANELKVSLDTLINIDIQSLTPTEAYVLKVLEKLQRDTASSELFWHREDKEILLRMDDEEGDAHPLFEGAQHMSEEPMECYSYARYKHIAPSDEDVIVSGHFYHATLEHNILLYLTTVDYTDMKNVHEIFIVGNDLLGPVCSTYTVRPEITTKINMLYSDITEAMKRPMIDKNVKEVLDNYLIEIPF